MINVASDTASFDIAMQLEAHRLNWSSVWGSLNRICAVNVVTDLEIY